MWYSRVDTYQGRKKSRSQSLSYVKRSPKSLKSKSYGLRNPCATASRAWPPGPKRNKAPPSSRPFGEEGSPTWTLENFESLPPIRYHQPSGPRRGACPPCSPNSIEKSFVGGPSARPSPLASVKRHNPPSPQNRRSFPSKHRPMPPVRVGAKSSASSATPSPLRSKSVRI